MESARATRERPPCPGEQLWPSCSTGLWRSFLNTKSQDGERGVKSRARESIKAPRVERLFKLAKSWPKTLGVLLDQTPGYREMENVTEIGGGISAT